MCLIQYMINRHLRNSEGGFVLIAALMAVMILIAVGFFALTTTTQDMRISSKLVAERKAMSAAEAGVHWVTLNFTPTMTTASNQPVDAANDPHARFSTTAPVINLIMPTIIATGWDVAMEYHIYNVSVTGTDDSHNSSVIIDAGFKDGPWPGGTPYE
jgi:hypothetical protein